MESINALRKYYNINDRFINKMLKYKDNIKGEQIPLVIFYKLFYGGDYLISWVVFPFFAVGLYILYINQPLINKFLQEEMIKIISNRVPLINILPSARYEVGIAEFFLQYLRIIDKIPEYNSYRDWKNGFRILNEELKSNPFVMFWLE